MRKFKLRSMMIIGCCISVCRIIQLCKRFFQSEYVNRDRSCRCYTKLNITRAQNLSPIRRKLSKKLEINLNRPNVISDRYIRNLQIPNLADQCYLSHFVLSSIINYIKLYLTKRRLVSNDFTGVICQKRTFVVRWKEFKSSVCQKNRAKTTKKFPREFLTKPKDPDKSANISISRRKRRANEHSGYERHPDSGDFTVHRSSYKA